MWLSQENEDQRRPEDHQPQTSQRPQTIDDRLKLKFPKSARILYRSHFKTLFQSGRRLRGEVLSIDFRQGRAPCPRLGITVSRKHGKAHDRNRFKRLVRELFRASYEILPRSLEINVCPRHIPLTLEREKIAADFAQLVDKIRSLNL